MWFYLFLLTNNIAGIHLFHNNSATISYCSIGKLLHHWKVHCQWPSDTHGVDPDSDELLDSLVEANDILLEQVVSVFVLVNT